MREAVDPKLPYGTVRFLLPPASFLSPVVTAVLIFVVVVIVVIVVVVVVVVIVLVLVRATDANVSGPSEDGPAGRSYGTGGKVTDGRYVVVVAVASSSPPRRRLPS